MLHYSGTVKVRKKARSGHLLTVWKAPACRTLSIPSLFAAKKFLQEGSFRSFAYHLESTLFHTSCLCPPLLPEKNRPQEVTFMPCDNCLESCFPARTFARRALSDGEKRTPFSHVITIWKLHECAHLFTKWRKRDCVENETGAPPLQGRPRVRAVRRLFTGCFSSSCPGVWRAPWRGRRRWTPVRD